MTERMTVTLSDETSKILKAYCEQRQMNRSSASAGFIADGLDAWLKTQQSLTKDTPFDFSVVTSGRSVLSSTLETLLRSKLAENVLGNPNDDRNMLVALQKSLSTVGHFLVPDDSFDKVSRATIRKNVYIALLQTYIVIHVFENRLTDDERKTFNAMVFGETGLNMIQIDTFQLSMEMMNVISAIYNVRCHYNSLTPDLSQQIDAFVQNHKNGKIVVWGLTGVGKTTLAVDIAQRYQGYINVPDELRNASDLRDVFIPDGLAVATLHANSQTKLSQRLRDINDIELATDNNEMRYDNELKQRDVMFIEVVQSSYTSSVTGTTYNNRYVGKISYEKVF